MDFKLLFSSSCYVTPWPGDTKYSHSREYTLCDDGNDFSKSNPVH